MGKTLPVAFGVTGILGTHKGCLYVVMLGMPVVEAGLVPAPVWAPIHRGRKFGHPQGVPLPIGMRMPVVGAGLVPAPRVQDP